MKKVKFEYKKGDKLYYLDDDNNIEVVTIRGFRAVIENDIPKVYYYSGTDKYDQDKLFRTKRGVLNILFDRHQEETKRVLKFLNDNPINN